MTFRFAKPQPRRRPSLTPMIDVVFLLLVFFMLAARFGVQGGLDLRIAGGGASTWVGPPRLVQVDAETLRLNGQPSDLAGIISTLTGMIDPEGDLILLQATDDTDLQRLLDVMTALNAADLTNLALVSP